MRLYLDLVAILAVATLSRAQVRLWQGTLTLPTYEKGCLTPVLPSTRVGDREEAEQRYQQGLLLPDRMLAHYLTRLARAQVVTKVE